MKRFLFGVTTLILGSAAAGWASADNLASLLPQVAHYVPPPVEPAGLVTIYDDLARKYPRGLYNAYTGDLVAGPQNTAAQPQAMEAAAFVPSADRVATRIQVGAVLQGGKSEVVIGLYDDNADAPGNALQVWHVRNLPLSCCGLITVKSDGIALTAGHKYWVVLSTDNSDPDLFLLWQWNDTDQVDQGESELYCTDTATQCGFGEGQWTHWPNRPALAFSVQGE